MRRSRGRSGGARSFVVSGAQRGRSARRVLARVLRPSLNGAIAGDSRPAVSAQGIGRRQTEGLAPLNIPARPERLRPLSARRVRAKARGLRRVEGGGRAGARRLAGSRPSPQAGVRSRGARRSADRSRSRWPCGLAARRACGAERIERRPARACAAERGHKGRSGLAAAPSCDPGRLHSLGSLLQ